MEPLGLLMSLLLGGAGGYGLALRKRQLSSASLAVVALQQQCSNIEAELQQMCIGERLATLEQQIKGTALRLELHTGMFEALEKQQEAARETVTQLAKDTLALGTEMKGGLSALEVEFNSSATTGESRFEELASAMDERLKEMQSFIVQAAEQAKARRELLPRPEAGGAVAGGAGELAQLMEQQRQAQQVFAARRRAEGAANFQAPNGAGL
jgi:hypothetical protein